MRKIILMAIPVKIKKSITPLKIIISFDNVDMDIIIGDT